MLAQAGYTFPFLSDPNTDAIKRYDLLHEGQGANGGAISRPAEFLLDSTGTVRWTMLTADYWVRARPEQIVAAAKAENNAQWAVRRLSISHLSFLICHCSRCLT